MKKGFKSLLSLILVFVSALVIVGCKKTTVVDDTNEVLGKAASYVFGLYKDTVGTKTDSFEVLNAVKIGDKKVTLTWALTVTDENNNAIENSEAVTLTKKNEAESTVYVGFYDGKVTSKILFTLAPSLTYKETTKTLVELEGEEGATKGVFKYSVDPMVLGNRTAWDALAKDKETSINIKGTVLGVLQDGSSKGSFYVQDEEGFGYYAYKPANAVTSAGKFNVKAGDIVIVSGTRSDYNGQQEFKQACTFKVIGSNGQPTVLDASADWAAAKSNTGLDAKYQNNYVKLENCKAVAIPGEGATEFLFTVGAGTVQWNIYDSYYFLSTEQRDAFKAAWAAAYNDGATFTVEGVSTYYNKYQIYGATFAPSIITVTGSMTDEEKCQGVIDEVSQVIPAYLLESKDITLPTTGRFNGVTAAWTLKTENANVKIENGVLKITKAAGLDKVELEVTATKGEASKKATLTITMVNSTITVSDFLAAADKTNVQYVEGVVAAIKGDAKTAGSFVLVGTDGKAIFSYNSLLLHVGEKVVIAAKFAENGSGGVKFPQMGSIAVVAVLATEQQVPGTATEFSRADLESMDITVAGLAQWTGKLLKTVGYAKSTSTTDKTKWSFYEDAEFKNLIFSAYAGTELGIVEGKYYNVAGYARGLGKGFITLQVASIEETKAPITVEPKDLAADATQPVVLKLAEGQLVVAENKIAKSETVSIVFYTDKACETAANLSGKYDSIEGIAIKGTDSTISFYVTKAVEHKVAEHAGTEADPYSVADAKIIGAGLSESKRENNENVYGDLVMGWFKGYVIAQGSDKGTYLQNVTLGDTKDATSTLIVYSVNVTETLKNVGTGDLVVIKGYLMNWQGTIELSSAKGAQDSATVYPVFTSIAERAKGTISVDSTSSDKATVTLPSTTSVDNGTEVEFTVAVTEGYVITEVKVSGATITATEGKYKVIVRGETKVVVSTKDASDTKKVITIDMSDSSITFDSSTDSDTPTAKTIAGVDLEFSKCARNSGYIFMNHASCVYNVTALSGKIVKIEVVTTNGGSGTAVYNVTLGTAKNGVVTTNASHQQTGNGTLTVTATVEDGFTFFNISQTNTSKNGQIAKIIITIDEAA